MVTGPDEVGAGAGGCVVANSVDAFLEEEDIKDDF